MKDMPGIGHNSDPFGEALEAVERIYGEAQHWMDGAAVETQAEADMIGKLLDDARKAKKQADEARKTEKQPHADAAKAVDERFKPLLSKCDLIADTAKNALAPFLAAQEAAKRAAERVAREKAEAAQRAAQQAMRAAETLAQREEAERAVEAAKSADIAARVAAKDKGHAKGGSRAVSLRTVYEPEITDLRALMRWMWENDRSAFQGFAETYVAGAVRAGQRTMDGVTIHERKVAV